MTTLFLWLVVIPFILGFITYGIHTLLKPPTTSTTPTSKPISIQIPPEAMKQLQEEGYLDPVTGKLKETATPLIEFKVNSAS